ncbi:hypothetical protein BGLA2_1380031 [Burkholderia gladioli]|nr:hypothetical protein BGLA2_1380031 [Burkholderia gladioli]
MAASCQPRHWQLVERKISIDSVHSADKPGPPKQPFRSREHAVHVTACNRYPGDTTVNLPYLVAPHAQNTLGPKLRFFPIGASHSPFAHMVNYDFNAASRRSAVHLGSSRRAAANGTNNAFSVADECEAAAIALLARSTLLSHPFPSMLGSCEHQKLPRRRHTGHLIKSVSLRKHELGRLPFRTTHCSLAPLQSHGDHFDQLPLRQ